MRGMRSLVVGVVFAFSSATVAWAAALPSAPPEHVGLSAERLARIGAVLTAEIERGQFPGGGGVATVGDYARFLQMLLNGGQLDGVRLLSRTTVSYMTSDHLGEMKSAGTVALMPPIGFGLGFAVRKETGPAGVPGSAGEYYWAGAAGTGFWVDPKEGLICIFMTQVAPGAPRRYDRQLFKQLVYQAIND